MTKKQKSKRKPDLSSWDPLIHSKFIYELNKQYGLKVTKGYSV